MLNFTINFLFSGSLDINGQKHKLNIFDNAGQHDYDNMRTTSYKENECLVLCYSVADRDSLESVKEFWVPELRNCAGRRKPVILVATQTDLRTDNGNFISTAEGEILAKDIGAESFLECSAFVKDSVTKVFRQMTTAGLRYRKKRVGLVNRIFGK